ncbi:hypothetical protein N0B44_17475 [Roseibacterium beibuensis]|uniref:hypothetical protein n=1 Tax=[Roseibacterium] beibuensis TaxID=1193142 RepID=UPI00217CFCB2|nr:hypothetical protein [Roseibacterium beibuensis]MCS6624711.1 hypothetical protein [Roseibacterium beibuensis]
MTHPDPVRSNPPGPKRSPRFNGLILLGVVALFVIAAIFVWSLWSVEDDSAADYARDHPVQPAELPPPDAGSLSPEGKEAAGTSPTAP